MSGREELMEEDITRIVTLSDAGHQTKKISELTGGSGRIIRRWVARYKEKGGVHIPTQKARSGRPKRVNKAALNIIKRDKEGPSLYHVL